VGRRGPENGPPLDPGTSRYPRGTCWAREKVGRTSNCRAFYFFLFVATRPHPTDRRTLRAAVHVGPDPISGDQAADVLDGTSGGLMVYLSRKKKTWG